MLTQQDNELLCRVGAGTPMGELLRHYWLPFLFDWEVEADDAPQRVRLLGEDLIVFRDTQGKVGLLGDHCSHRGASLFFGRNEECGLRCVYHGWKYDVEGHCVDMPNEPAFRGTESGDGGSEESSSLGAQAEPAFRWTDSGDRDSGERSSLGAQAEAGTGFKDKIRHLAYPCVEGGGIVWAYMGRTGPPPPLPHFEWMDVPAQHRYGSKRVQYSNWVQAMEGDIDQSHVSFVHSRLNLDNGNGRGAGGGGPQRLVEQIRKSDTHPRFEVFETDYGVCIGAGRQAPGGDQYWRITQHLMPFHTMTGPYGENPTRGYRAWVPIDDENVFVMGLTFHPNRALTEQELDRQANRSGVSNISPEMRLPATSAPFGRWLARPDLSNDFFVDREVQRTQTYSGISEFWAQDALSQLSMGPIYDRSKEHLGTSDTAIMAVRRRLLRAAKELRDEGIVPSQAVNPECYQVRSDALLLENGESWIDATSERRKVLAGVNPSCPA